MKRIDNKKNLYKSIILLVILAIGIGYAYLTSNLSITGATEVVANTWDIHFANLNEAEGSVIAASPAIINSDNASINYSITLSRPKEYYEFTVDVVNEGTLPGKVSISELSGLDATSSKVIDYSIKYTYGQPVNVGDILNAGATKTIKIRVYYKDDITANDFPENDLNLNLTYTLQYLQSEKDEVTTGTLLQNLSSSNSCIEKYEGDVTDRVGVTEEATNVYFNKCENKRNIIFGGFCWQVIRTTETGGLKMIYNGEPVDGKCESTRENHKGIVGSSETTSRMNYNYLYGTSFDYDISNNSFILKDTTYSILNEDTYENIIGKYTCRNNTGTCNTLYNVNSYQSSDIAYISSYVLNNTNYAQIGESPFNADDSSIANVGYMFNEVYNSVEIDLRSSETTLTTSSINTSYWYADSVVWGNPISDNYNLINAYQLDSNVDYSSLVGKYTFMNTSEIYTNTFVYYIAAVENNYMYLITLLDGNDYSYYDYSYTYGDDYHDNGDGTYTIKNEDDSSPVTVKRLDWKSNYNNLNKKYVCKNALNNTCDDVWYVYYSTANFMYYLRSSRVIKYSKGFTYDENTNTYTLSGESVSFWNSYDNTNLTSINNYHYTCWNETGMCSTLSYIYYTESGIIFYYLNVNKNVEDVLDEMIINDYVNKYDSSIKGIVDNWYKKNLFNETDMLEDVVYCNSRKVSNIGGFNSNGGFINSSLEFKISADDKNLSCPNRVDQFSLSNKKAQLEYPIGLLRYEEVKNVAIDNFMKTGSGWWTLTPSRIGGRYAYVKGIGPEGYIRYGSLRSTYGVRPVVSLASYATISSGSGSTTDPWVVE